MKAFDHALGREHLQTTVYSRDNGWLAQALNQLILPMPMIETDYSYSCMMCVR